MPEMKLFTSNKLEVLADLLAGVVRVPLSSPFVPEVVVVQSRGMERWVSMELSRRLGVWANCRFPFPNAFVKQIFAAVLGQAASLDLWNPDVLSWRIMGLLPGFLDNPAFYPLRNYLSAEHESPGQGNAGRELKLFQLADRIADVFDQYSIFRPEMIAAWETGETGEAGAAGGQTPPDQQWQAELWRALAGQTPLRCRAGIRAEFLELLRRDGIDPMGLRGRAGLPQRISVFGVSELPKFHIEIFLELSKLMDVNLFIMNPCKEYWFDIVPQKVIVREKKPAQHHREEGNSLLASMGKSARDFFSILADMGVEEDSFFPDSMADDEKNLLTRVQADILHLRRRGVDNAPKARLDLDDESIRVHSCHGPMREVEALRDHLLDLFQQFPDIAPRDIVVMAPDIEAYTPFIQAVFAAPRDAFRDSAKDSGQDAAQAIPFSIADRTARRGSEIIDAFLAVLELGAGRFGAAQVLDLLENQAIKQKFILSDREAETARRWAFEAGIRWGVDAEHRRELGLPGFSENTWEAGIDRMLLGYAMSVDGDNLFKGILPFDAVEGAEAATALGKLVEFRDRLFSSVRGLSRPRLLSAWAEDLIALFESLFQPLEDEESETGMIRQALLGLAEIERLSGFDQPADFSVIRAWLTSSLGGASLGGGFLSAGVTFCAMVPMRGIPFRVLCLLGMNDAAFPRREKPLSFDLTASHPRPGDRSLRGEDRWLFLEALLSARDRLHISYVGQSQRDGKDLPPSVLVSELLDAVDQGFFIADDEDKKPSEILVVKHRLQAFSPAYFSNQGSLFSYSKENFSASRLLAPEASRKKRGLFIDHPLPPPLEEDRQIELAELMGFFSNPAKRLLQKRLGFSLANKDETTEDREPFEVAGFEKYSLEQGLVDRRLTGKTAEEKELAGALPILKARGELPHGVVGEVGFVSLARETGAFLRKVETHLKAAALEPVSFELALGDFRLEGRITGLRENGLALFRPAKLKAKDYIKGWLQHLALNLLAHNLIDDLELPDLPRTTRIIGKDKVAELPPLEDAASLLLNLLEIYWQGLSEAAPFFPEASLAYANGLRGKNGGRQKALSSARGKWEGGMYASAEADDPNFALCFGEVDPLDERFEELAERVFGPMLDLLEK